MENRAYALAAGLFTLLLGMGVVAVALWFGGNTVETRTYTLTSRYPVSGLNPQAPVRYRGVTVGKVVSIKFDPVETGNILVDVSVEAGTPLTKGIYAQLGSQGVTGLAYVILDNDAGKSEPLVASDGSAARIEVRQSFMDGVSESGQDMINNFNQVAKRVSLLLSDENQKQLVSTLRNLDLIAARVATLTNEMTPTLKGLPALASNAGVAMKSADTLFSSLTQRLDTFERAAKGAEQLAGSGVALSETMLSESLPRLNLLLDDLVVSSRRLDRMLNDINEQPHSLVFGRNPLPPGPGEPGYSTTKGAR